MPIICKIRKARFLFAIISFIFFYIGITAQAWAFLDYMKRVSHNTGSTGRGCTSIAIGDDPSNMIFNPAVISEIKSNAFDAHLLLVTTDLNVKYTGTGNETFASKNKDRIGAIPSFSYVHNNKNSPWSWGIGLAVPDGFYTDYTIKSKYYGSVNAFSEIMHMRIAPTVAYQLTSKLSIGARVGADYGSLDLRTPLGIAFFDIGLCDSFGFSGAIGLLYKPLKNLSFGLYYENTMMQDMKTRNADGYISIMTSDGEASFSNLYVKVKDFQFPQHCGFGIAFRPSPSWRLSADIKYINWKKNWDELELEFTGAPGLPDSLKIPLSTDDQIPISIGVEYFFNDIYTFSIGYHFCDDVMSDDYLNPIIATEVQQIFTCGFSVMPAETAKFGVAFMYGVMDNSNSSDHGYDQYIEEQLGLSPGALDSELNNAKTDYTCYVLEFSLTMYW